MTRAEGRRLTDRVTQAPQYPGFLTVFLNGDKKNFAEKILWIRYNVCEPPPAVLIEVSSQQAIAIGS